MVRCIDTEGTELGLGIHAALSRPRQNWSVAMLGLATDLAGGNLLLSVPRPWVPRLLSSKK